MFDINSGGAGNSSSDMLSQVPGVGARLPKSSESTNIILQSVKIDKHLDAFLSGKIKDTMSGQTMNRGVAQQPVGVKIPKTERIQVEKTQMQPQLSPTKPLRVEPQVPKPVVEGAGGSSSNGSVSQTK